MFVGFSRWVMLAGVRRHPVGCVEESKGSLGWVLARSEKRPRADAGDRRHIVLVDRARTWLYPLFIRALKPLRARCSGHGGRPLAGAERSWLCRTASLLTSARPASHQSRC